MDEAGCLVGLPAMSGYVVRAAGGGSGGGLGKGGLTGRWLKEGSVLRKSTASRGGFQRFRKFRLVGEAGHSNRCLLVCGAPQQTGQRLSGAVPIDTL
jgi:hypothetical protein